MSSATMQPPNATIRSERISFSGLSEPARPKAFSSAACRTLHVFMTTRSASAALLIDSCPRSDSSRANLSESATFI